MDKAEASAYSMHWWRPQMSLPVDHRILGSPFEVGEFISAYQVSIPLLLRVAAE